MKQVAIVEQDGRVFLIFEGDGVFWAVESEYVSPIFPHGFALHKALKRDSLEGAKLAVKVRGGIEKIMQETGQNFLFATIDYIEQLREGGL